MNRGPPLPSDVLQIDVVAGLQLSLHAILISLLTFFSFVVDSLWRFSLLAPYAVSSTTLNLVNLPKIQHQIPVLMFTIAASSHHHRHCHFRRRSSRRRSIISIATMIMSLFLLCQIATPVEAKKKDKKNKGDKKNRIKTNNDDKNGKWNGPEEMLDLDSTSKSASAGIPIDNAAVAPVLVDAIDMNATETTSLVEVMIETGRRHQIRMAMQHLGTPVVGDERHGAGTNPHKRIMLHAASLEFLHPDTDDPVRFEAPLPASFRL